MLIIIVWLTQIIMYVLVFKSFKHGDILRSKKILQDINDILVCLTSDIELMFNMLGHRPSVQM